MKDSEIKYNNEIIAGFMGYKYYPYRDDEKGMLHGWIREGAKRTGIYKIANERGLMLARRTNDLRYHTSFDWFMPVYAKFSALEFDDSDATAVHEDYCVSIAEKVLECDVSLACEKLAEGIRWYNQTNKTKENEGQKNTNEHSN